MNEYNQRIVACHGCPLHKAGLCVDGRKIQAHTKAVYCPRPNPPFGDGVKPDDWDIEAQEPNRMGLGDVVELVLRKTSLDRIAKPIKARLNGGSCNCSEDQRKLNEWGDLVLERVQIVLSRLKVAVRSGGGEEGSPVRPLNDLGRAPAERDAIEP